MSEQDRLDDVLAAMRKCWPSAIVARSKVGEFSGGLLCSRTLANLDSLGQGPPRFRMGARGVFYAVDDLLVFIRERSTEGGESDAA